MADVTKKVSDIRMAIYGEQVREALASGIEVINDEVMTTTGKQEALQIIFDNLIINAGNSNAEIVAARGVQATLNARLNASDAQMAQAASQTALNTTNANVAQNLTHINEMRQSVDITITVGVGGDTNSINTAIDYLSKRRAKYKQGGLKAEVKLLSGYIMEEQVIVNGQNLGWIEITSVDPIVIINRESLTQQITFPSYDGGHTFAITSRSAFMAINNAVLPQIKVLFEMNVTGDRTNRDGLFTCNNSSAFVKEGCGVKNAGGKGIYCLQASNVAAMGAIFSGAGGTGVSCFRGSRVAIRGGDVSNSGSHGLYADSSSIIEALKAIIVYCGEFAVYADSNSMINCNHATLSNSISDGIRALNNASVDAAHAIIDDVGGSGVRCIGARVSVPNAKIRNANTDGVTCQTAGTVNAQDAIVTGAGSRGIDSAWGSILNASGADCRRFAGETTTTDMRVRFGGVIVAYNALGGHTSATPVNSITASGIIYR